VRTLAEQKNPVKQSQKARLRAIEIAKAEIELKAAKGDLAYDQLRLKAAQREYRWKGASDREYGIFNLETSVGSGTVALAAEIRQWGRLNPGKPITLNIFSPGGAVFHGLVLYDTLRSLSKKGHNVTTYAHGYAASMGSLLFLAGDVRIIGAESQLMFHALSSMALGSLHELEDEIEFCKRLNARLDKIVTSRTKVTAKMLKEKSHKKDWWMPADEAITLGVAHEID